MLATARERKIVAMAPLSWKDKGPPSGDPASAALS
jgi:hypothetical protein